jgi:hypothetical protein
MIVEKCRSAVAVAPPRGIELDCVEPLERGLCGGEESGHRLGKSVAVIGPCTGLDNIAHFITPFLKTANAAGLWE